MAESIEFEGRLWAIVGTGQKQYIGMVEASGEHEHKSACPPYIELCPCYELVSVLQMMRFPDGTQSPARELLVLPVDKCKHDVRRRFRPVDLMWAEDIHKDDRRLYVSMIEDLKQQALEARLQESGITGPPPGFDPSKFQGGGGFGRA